MSVLLPAIVSLLFAGGIHEDPTCPKGVTCPQAKPLTPRLHKIVRKAKSRALSKPSLSDVGITLRPALRPGLLAEVAGTEIQLSRVELDTVVEVFGSKTEDGEDEVAVDYLTFALAHEAQHIVQPGYDGTCSSLDAELDADRGATHSTRRGSLVINGMLLHKFEDLRDARQKGAVDDEASICVNILELSVRDHAITNYVATGPRAHHYYESTAEMHESVTKAYELQEQAFVDFLASCEAAVARLPRSCDDRSTMSPSAPASCSEDDAEQMQEFASCQDTRLQKVQDHRETLFAPPPRSPQEWDVKGPWPRFSGSKIAVDVATGFGAHWLRDVVDEPRASRMGPLAELVLSRRPKARVFAKGRVISTTVGARLGYHALLRGGADPIHRLHAGVALERAASLGPVAGGVAVGAGYGQDFRTDADQFGFQVRGGAHGQVRIHRNLELVSRLNYVALVSFAEQRTRRIQDTYSHGMHVSLGLAAYFGLN